LRAEPRSSKRTGRAQRASTWGSSSTSEVADKSFNDAAYAGLVRAERELDADGSFLEPVNSEDREAALRQVPSE
jgi:hypothetical protein